MSGGDESLFTTSPRIRLSGWATVAASGVLLSFYALWFVLVWTGQDRPPHMDAVIYVGVLFVLSWTFGRRAASTLRGVLSDLPIRIESRSER